MSKSHTDQKQLECSASARAYLSKLQVDPKHLTEDEVSQVEHAVAMGYLPDPYVASSSTGVWSDHDDIASALTEQDHCNTKLGMNTAVYDRSSDICISSILARKGVILDGQQAAYDRVWGKFNFGRGFI